MAINKGFIKDYQGNTLLPITRGELILDQDGNKAFSSPYFAAGYNGNAYGLISAADLAKITGSTTGQSLGDLYTKLGFINDGIKVGNQTLHFYNDTPKATNISFNTTEEGALNLYASNNNIIIGLKDINAASEITTFITSINVDKFGRVTSVSGRDLLNSDIPEELSNKKLDGCTTLSEIVPDNEKAIVNKKYVDSKIAEITEIATGALSFGGSITSIEDANNKLNANNVNKYYKITTQFTYPVDNLYKESNDVSYKGYFGVGDTVIVYNAGDSGIKFIWIPSGDDVTAITIKSQDATQSSLQNAVGNVYLEFQDIFNITNSNDRSAVISLKPASNSTGGYLTKEDWAKFNTYASKTISYTPTVDQGLGVYEIGKLTLDGSEIEINGINSIASLVLEGTTNPQLKFNSGASEDNYLVTYQGSNGIIVNRNASTAPNTINISANISTESTDYIEIKDGYKVNVKLANLTQDLNQTTNGLMDYTKTLQLITSLSIGFEAVSGSLIESDPNKDKTYTYGSTNLKNAVAVTI